MHALRGPWFAAKYKEAKDAVRVDADRICAMLLDECHPHQRGFVEDTGDRVCSNVGRGGGKTTGARARLVRRMLKTRKAKCLFIATTRPQAEKLMWAPLKDLLANLGIPARYNETKLTCTFVHNGSQLVLASADDKKSIEPLRGLPHHEVCIDECASYPTALLKTLIERIIEPRLGDYDGKLVLTGTPGHILQGLFYEATRAGSDQHRPWKDRHLPEHEDSDVEWSYHHWTLKDGAETVPALARLWKSALKIKRKKGWSDDHPVWRREYLGIWASDDSATVFKYRPHLDDGHPWNRWDPEKHTNGFAKLPEEFDEWSYVYGMDMGHSDPFALCVFAYAEHDPSKTLYHVYEFSKTEMFAMPICKLLIGENLNASEPEGCIGHTGWPNALVADCAGLGGGVLEEMATVYGVRAVPAEKKQKHDNIELFNGDLIDNRIKVLKDSVLETQLLTLQWDIDDYGRLREHKGMRNDMTDAAVYARRAAHHLLSAEEEPASPYFPERKDPMIIPDGDENDPDDFSSYLDDQSYDGF